VSLFAAASVTMSAGNLFPDTKFSDTSGWGVWANTPVWDAGGSVKLQDGKAIVKSPVIEKQGDANIQVIKSIVLDADKSYILKFKANADKVGEITVVYALNKIPFVRYASAIVALKAGEKDYECKLAVKKDSNGNYAEPRALRMYFGAFKDATVTVSDVSIEEVK